MLRDEAVLRPSAVRKLSAGNVNVERDGGVGGVAVIACSLGGLSRRSCRSFYLIAAMDVVWVGWVGAERPESTGGDQ
jgi:hypothetical protein